MSNVTDVFVIVGDSENDRGGCSAEDTAQEVAEAISAFVYNEPHSVPVISLKRDDWQSLQSGKVAGSAVIWFGWNYAQPERLEKYLKSLGFKHITVWSHNEFAGMDGIAPRVVSW